MGKKSTVILGIALVVILAAAGFLYTRLAPGVQNSQLANEPSQSEGSSSSSSSSSQQANPAPSFPMEDSQGNTVQLSDFLGDKPVFLNFWASTCSPCKQEMPDIQALYEQYGDQIHFVLVNVRGHERHPGKGGELSEGGRIHLPGVLRRGLPGHLNLRYQLLPLLHLY